jgi:colanic acid/amylovoran biosynthesis glycosyltransferase
MRQDAAANPIALDAQRVHATGATPASRRKRVGYLVNQYPTVSHTFIRREIAAVERCGAVDVGRYSLRRAVHGFVDSADHLEAAKTRVVLDSSKISLAATLLRTGLQSPARFLSALALTVATGWGSDRGLLRHFAYLVQAAALLHALRQDGVDHVHAHFGTKAAAVAMLCRELGGPPYSFTIHGPLEFELARLLSLREKIARAEFVVGITEFCRSQIWRNCDPAHWNKVHVVSCGVDAGFLDRDPEPISKAPTLVFVGRLSDHKAPGLLVEAAGQLQRAGIRFQLTFAGDGELRSDLEAAIARCNLGERVRIAGFSDEPAVRKYMREARALVLPSFAEGLPVVIMEAFALGRPVVSTFVAGIPELVEPGKSGWLVPAGSVERLTDALREVIEAPVERLEAMGRVGRARVIERHDVAKSGQTLSDLFIQSGRPAAVHCQRPA